MACKTGQIIGGATRALGWRGHMWDAFEGGVVTQSILTNPVI